MKRKILIVLFSVISVICLCMGITACSGENVDGTYYSFVNGNYDYTEYIVLDNGEFTAGDGYGTYTVSGNTITFYETQLNQSFSCEISDGVIYVESDGTVYYYCKEGKVPKGYSVSESNSDSDSGPQADGDDSSEIDIYGVYYKQADGDLDEDFYIELYEDSQHVIVDGSFFYVTYQLSGNEITIKVYLSAAETISLYGTVSEDVIVISEADSIETDLLTSDTFIGNYYKDNTQYIVSADGVYYRLSNNNTEYEAAGLADNSITNIVIASEINGIPVTAITDYAFGDCASVESVAIPESITSIGSNAFYNCVSLTNISVSNANTAFKSINGDLYSYDGTQLIQYAIAKTAVLFSVPDSVTSIGDYAFYGCTSLESITISDSVISIGDYAFQNCTALSVVNLSNNSELESIGYSAFCNCVMIESLTIPAGVTYIGDYAFFCCTSLQSVVFNGTSKLGTIGGGAFSGCIALNSIAVPDSVTHIGYAAFRGCTALTSINLSDDNQLETIGEYAFYGCASLEDVNMPDSLTIIGTYAFYNCTSFTTINFGEDSKLETIGAYAFSGCSSVESITIPDSLTSIGNNAFMDCTLITSASIPALAISYIPKNSIKSVVITSGDSIVENAFYNRVSLISVVLSDSVTTIGDRAFSGCTSLVNIDMGTGITDIGGDAFFNCISIESITIPDSLTTISTTFNSCTSMTSASVPSLVISCLPMKSLQTLVITSGTSIAKNALNNFASLKSVTISDSVTSIGDYAFKNCAAEIIWGENPSITEIGSYAFSGYMGKSITIPDSVTTIGDYAFLDCNLLEKVIFGENSKLETIDGQSAFSGCTALAEISLPDGVTTIGNSAFYNCTSLESISIPDGVTTIGNSAFYNCTSLESIAIPDSVTAIGNSTFYKCYALKTAVIGNGVTSIGDEAFYNCHLLMNLTIGSSVTSIGDRAFYTAYKLVEIYNLSAIEITIGSTENGYVGYYAKNVYTPTSGSSHLVTEDDCLFIYDNYNEYYLLDYTGTKTELTLPTLTDDDGNIINYSINQYAFYDCTTLISVTIPDSVTSIGANAFCSSSLKSVIIGNGVTSIGSSAFNDCMSLVTVTIGSNVTSIGRTAFYWDLKLVEIYNLSAIEITLGSAENGYAAYYAKNVYTPASGSSHFVTEGDYLFIYDDDYNYYLVDYNGTETELTLPTLTDDDGNIINYSINQYAFYGCATLVSVTIPNCVTRIGKNAFTLCTSLISITIESGVTYIDDYAFSLCSSLETIIIPDSVTYIGDYLCYDCDSLISLTIGSGVMSIGNSSFLGCVSLTSITLSSNISAIGASAFGSCKYLESVYYCGTESEWNNINVSDYNTYLTSADVYYYSDSEPDYSDGYNYWHYVEGEIVVWSAAE